MAYSSEDLQNAIVTYVTSAEEISSTATNVKFVTISSMNPASQKRSFPKSMGLQDSVAKHVLMNIWTPPTWPWGGVSTPLTPS